jgi:hypothetical protein
VWTLTEFQKMVQDVLLEGNLSQCAFKEPNEPAEEFQTKCVKSPCLCV